MSRYARRRDANHADVVQLLADVGVEVLDLHTLAGALDLLVGVRGVLYLVELKDGLKPPSRRKVTKREQETIARFRAVGCPVLIASTEDELLAELGLTRSASATDATDG